MTRRSLLGFLLLISVCDDVAERLVVDVASGVDGSESEGLIHLRGQQEATRLVNSGGQRYEKMSYLRNF